MSMVGDYYTDKWVTKFPTIQDPLWWEQFKPEDFRWIPPVNNQDKVLEPVSRQEFDDLKKDVEECLALLRKAKEYDEKNNEPNCELEEKVALIKKVAELVGVNIEGVFQEI
jgi:hypothetical protein